MTSLESVDEALCGGWIDGTQRRMDEHTYLSGVHAPAAFVDLECAQHREGAALEGAGPHDTGQAGVCNAFSRPFGGVLA